jgi:hypothetical protein
MDLVVITGKKLIRGFTAHDRNVDTVAEMAALE